VNPQREEFLCYFSPLVISHRLKQQFSGILQTGIYNPSIVSITYSTEFVKKNMEGEKKNV
jgi:hypothetical protein